MPADRAASRDFVWSRADVRLHAPRRTAPCLTCLGFARVERLRPRLKAGRHEKWHEQWPPHRMATDWRVAEDADLLLEAGTTLRLVDVRWQSFYEHAFDARSLLFTVLDGPNRGSWLSWFETVDWLPAPLGGPCDEDGIDGLETLPGSEASL